MVEQVRPHLAFDEQSFVTAINDQKNLMASLRNIPQPFPKSWVKKPVAAAYWVYCKLTGTKWPNVAAHSGWATGNVVDSFLDASLAIKLGGSLWRKPCETVVPENLGDPKVRLTSELGVTDEMVHPSVFYRMQQLKKRSPSMAQWKRVPCKDPTKGWEYVKPGLNLTMREYRIQPHAASGPRNLERLTAEAVGAGDYLSQLDTMYEKGVDTTMEDNVTAVAV